MESKIDNLKSLYGDVTELTLPTGYKVTIRQQNGEDDDILSNSKNVADGSSSNKFIQAIVVDSDITEKGTLTLDVIGSLKLCDKYFIMIASRIFSLGQILKWNHTWPDNVEAKYEEDLGQYIWEYESGPVPELGDEDYFPYRIQAHPAGKEVYREFSTNSGKKLRYKYQNVNGEKYLMNLPEENTSINAELKSRGLEQEVQGNWVTVSSFKNFTSMDMMEIRSDVSKNDPGISLLSEITHPVTKQKIEFPLVATQDFFYPVLT